MGPREELSPPPPAFRPPSQNHLHLLINRLFPPLELTPLAAACKWVKAAGEQLESDEEEDYEDDDEAAGLSAPKPRPTPKAPTTIFVDEDGSYRVNNERS